MPAAANPELTFLKARGLDPAEWMATRLNIRENISAKGEKSSGVSATLARRPGSGVASALLKDLRRMARPARVRTGGKDLMVELHLSDLHVGARTAESSEHTVSLARRLLARVKDERPAEILLVLNGDILHVDSIRNETTRGTRLEDVKSPYWILFRIALHTITAIINDCSKIAPVVVLVVPGNHDFHAGFGLGEALRGAYLDKPQVCIFNSTEKFQYYNWGTVLLGFTHGDTIKLNQLPMLMASDEPQFWGATTWREWHTGHVHSQSQLEKGGCRVRSMPALVSRSDWARNQGYMESLRGVEAYLWSKTWGYRGHLFEAA